jgi:tRNA threonylcarbamoyladenosine biosynthesis protein TsaB
MLLLIIDTSGRQGFVALARAPKLIEHSSDVSLVQSAPLDGGTFSAQLVPQIAALLAAHGFTKSDIGAFLVVSGPGSFTGLRVGLAAIKALAEILQKPIVPVSLLEVIAVSGRKKEGKILSALDAGRGEIYLGEYEVKASDARRISEQLVTREEFSSAARNAPLITADVALANLAQDAGANVITIPAPDAAMIARYGWKKLHEAATVTPEQLEANYIRRTDAEIFAKTKP